MKNENSLAVRIYMGRYIVKLEHEGIAYYLEWSKVVDAPVSYGMPLDEFKEYCKNLYGESGMRGLLYSLARVEAKGVSAIDYANVEELTGFNRAGEKQTCLSLEQIIDYYVIRRGEGDRPVGTAVQDE